jgi:hypothetical protein
METSVVHVRRVDGSDADDVVLDGDRRTVPLMLMDGKRVDASELDDRTKAYLERNVDLQNAWQKNRGYRGLRPQNQPGQDMPAGARKPKPGLPGYDAAPPEDGRRATIDDAERTRSRAQAEYVDRISGAWKRKG